MTIKVSNFSGGLLQAPQRKNPSIENDLRSVALKTKEITNEDRTTEVATYILAFNIDGKILYDETKISDTKLEGIEFF